MAEIKDILKRLRIESGMSQAALANELNVGVSTVAMWETGRRFPNREACEALADIFNVDISYIYGHSDIRQAIHFDTDGNAMVHLTDREYLMLEYYRKLTPEWKDSIDKIMNLASNSTSIFKKD